VATRQIIHSEKEEEEETNISGGQCSDGEGDKKLFYKEFHVTPIAANTH